MLLKSIKYCLRDPFLAMEMLDVTTVRTAGELEARPRSTYTKHEK